MWFQAVWRHLLWDRPIAPGVCDLCGSRRDVREGLCRSCRRRTQDQGTAVPETERLETPPEPDLEPPHSRPWVHRGGG